MLEVAGRQGWGCVAMKVAAGNPVTVQLRSLTMVMVTQSHVHDEIRVN